MSEEKTQISFFKKIKAALPPQLSLVEEIAEQLSISNDSAYRRIRGETDLTMDELKKLMSHFKISPDLFASSTIDVVTFNYKKLESEASLEGYLQGILKDLKSISGFENKNILIAAKDIPIFHHFHFRELTAFKLFYWMKSVLNFSGLDEKKFTAAEIPENYFALTKEIFDIYTKIPSVEIWTEETINSSLNQVAFFWESGYFKEKEDAVKICDQLIEMANHIQKQAELTIKFHLGLKPIEQEGNYTFYYSDIIISNNNFLANMNENKLTYLTHNTFNSLITTNQSFCEETENYIKNLIKKSTQISGTSEKQRNQFFRKVQEEINKLKNKINN